VPGGAENLAGGLYSFAAGHDAKATNDGSFVWSDDSSSSPFASTNNNSFNVRASGGVQFVTSGAGVTVDGQPVAQSYGTAISSAPFTIFNPGSYYLTTNLTVSTGDTIDIQANGVTLNLNGFTISPTVNYNGNPGTAIKLENSGTTGITIVNGHIVSYVTYNSGNGTFTGPGFQNGIEVSGTAYNVRVCGVSVSGCLNDGINLGTANSTIVESCTVNTVGGAGIVAASVTRCTAINCGGDGIDATTASDCVGASINGAGLYATTASDCFGSGGGFCGLSAGVANNCTGKDDSDGGIGLFCVGSAIGCSAQANGVAGVAIEANIGNSCTVYPGNTENITYKYNMP